MKECWNDGDLRAYADRELPPAEMEKLAAHLAACAGCEARSREVAERAVRVCAWMAELRAPAPAVTARPVRPVSTWPRWAAALTAAAGLALLLMNPGAKLSTTQGTAAISRHFVALDDEPIDTGMVVRVAVGPNQVQADVIIGPDGRARAFRLVGEPSSN